MMVAFTFNNAWLLLGLLAAAIPVLLHLLSSVRAPEVFFPTLRFLNISMEKTARRRRLEHWLLLVIRSLLLAMLALAVAEPILQAASGFLADKRFAAVLVVDNSHSMGVQDAGSSRFEHARREAAKLLGGKNKPSLSAVLPTNGAAGEPDLRGDLEAVRSTLEQTRLASGRASIAERIDRALAMLRAETVPQKAIYVFSDLQRISFDRLGDLGELKRANVPLMLVDCSGKRPVNVGVADLQIGGARVVDQSLEFTATLINSSATDKVVNVWLKIDGRNQPDPVRQTLARAGKPGAKATVRFRHRFTSPGVHTGQVGLDAADDLSFDNARSFSLDIAGRVGALLVRPDARAAGAYDPGAMLQIALDPNAGQPDPGPWSVKLKTISPEQFAPAALAGTQAAFFADVPSFTPAQADAIEAFIRRGGSATFFLGPGADPAAYNKLFFERFADAGGLLPKLAQAVGQIGHTAEAIRAVRHLDHPYLRRLYDTAADYPDVLVQRYYRLAGRADGWEKVLSTPDGRPLVAARDYRKGRVVLFATTASVEWNKLATTTLLLSMATRICLASGHQAGSDQTYPAGAAVTIRPTAPLGPQAAVNVTAPGAKAPVPLPLTDAQAVFARTAQAGIYEWDVVGAAPDVVGAHGAFAVNPDGSESDLSALAPRAVKAGVQADVYIGPSLDAVHAAAADAAGGDNLWDRLLVVVIGLLVVEAVVANRFRRGAEPVPAHLNPRLAGAGAGEPAGEPERRSA